MSVVDIIETAGAIATLIMLACVFLGVAMAVVGGAVKGLRWLIRWLERLTDWEW